MGTEFLLVDASDETGAYYALVLIHDYSVSDFRRRAERFHITDADVPWKLESMSEEVVGVPFIEIRGEHADVIPNLETMGGSMLVSEERLAGISKEDVTIIKGHVRMCWGSDGFCWVMNSAKGNRYLTQYVELEDLERAIRGEDYEESPSEPTSLVMLAEQYLGEQCGQCDCYHPAGYVDDCRDDLNRFGAPEELADLWAAAPGTLQALEQLVRFIETEPGCSSEVIKLIKAHEQIALAKGERHANQGHD